MAESHRIRNSKRQVLIIENASRYGYIVCEFCGEVTHTPQIDHYTARNNGGDAKDISNCVVACPSCNGRKCDHDAAELFGADVAARIEAMLATRTFTAEMWEAARFVDRVTKRTDKRIELIYNWIRGENEQ